MLNRNYIHHKQFVLKILLHNVGKMVIQFYRRTNLFIQPLPNILIQYNYLYYICGVMQLDNVEQYIIYFALSKRRYNVLCLNVNMYRQLCSMCDCRCLYSFNIRFDFLYKNIKSVTPGRGGCFQFIIVPSYVQKI